MIVTQGDFDLFYQASERAFPSSCTLQADLHFVKILTRGSWESGDLWLIGII